MAVEPVLLIHGGAGLSPSLSGRASRLRSLTNIRDLIYPRLLNDDCAVDAVGEAVALLEDDPFFNAGLGAKLQADGQARLTAAIMDGATSRFAGCINALGIKNPVDLARHLLDFDDRVLSGRESTRFAKQLGLLFRSPVTTARLREYKRQLKGAYGTVGAVALDRQGRLAAATSTGGRGFEQPGRVSDSATVAGTCANEKGAVSASGQGEQIVEQALAAGICERLLVGQSLRTAVDEKFKMINERRAQIAVISVDHRGDFVARASTPQFLWAVANPRTRQTCSAAGAYGAAPRSPGTR